MSGTITGWHKAHAVSVLLVVVFVQVVELVLLQLKYNIFTGGFLLPHTYLNWGERTLFLVTSVWVDLAMFVVLSLPWFWVSRRLKLRPFLVAYNFVVLSIGIYGAWLALKFKLLSYFNDTLNYLIIQNLAGGSFLDGLSFITHEATLFITGLLLYLSVYWLGLYLIKRDPAHMVAVDASIDRTRVSAWWLAPIIVLTVCVTALVNLDPPLRYGLKKKTSFVIVSSFLDRITDFDFDGYGLFHYPVDTANLNPDIYPGALDVPGNGIDENRYGGDFIAADADVDALEKLEPRPGKHVILILLESARSDILGKQWQGKDVAPNVTRLAETGTSFDYAYSHHGFTVTSLKTLFNRTFSSGHDRVLFNDYLRQSGYSLSFISGQDESFGGIDVATRMSVEGNYLFDARTAIEDRVYPSRDSGSLRLSEARVYEQFETRSNEVDWNKPQFFYINFQAAHFPYTHPGMPLLVTDSAIKRSDINKENSKQLQATYWNALAVADQAVGKVLEQLKKLGVYDDALVVVVGDHGESLFDDNFLGHGHALNEAQTKIPFVISTPGLEIKKAIGQVNVAELIMHAASDRYDIEELSASMQPQLQIVGSLNQPQLIGIVTYGGVRTTLDTRSRKLFFSDLKRWVDYDKAVMDPKLRERTNVLINLWEVARWNDHQTRQLDKSKK